MPKLAIQDDRPQPSPASRPRLWRRHPAVLVVLVVAGSTVLLGTWLAFGRSDSWSDWLADMKYSSSTADRFGDVFAKPDAEVGGPKYLGRGKADLGSYSVRIFNPAGRTTLRTDFRLEGRTVCPDEEKFDEFMKHNHRFFREQVKVALRNCESRDLADPRLRLLEKKLVTRVNRALGRRFLKSAQIKDFLLYESVEKSGFVERDPAELAAAP